MLRVSVVLKHLRILYVLLPEALVSLTLNHGVNQSDVMGLQVCGLGSQVWVDGPITARKNKLEFMV